ncbi:4Fe-4S dicluster domain-containing protein [Frankia sp. AgB1.9]|uniref:4Fe-4S dicluster domain-containing protein n=1 Tax=unclassified Frankia TaxID=2632575 RepID=UPI001933FDB5|nr:MULTISPECIES: 4Fe-4S dicluster domain-containing protein [unclassified Frankia]MBL7487999.1 4Fe-4S dicluster domain-containing protein [Frankia sp. AgW1.1]MBL7549437.1 4Fe-4S dicluster domain-containing protein [Frankia sp. AgB1.9]MBL7619947.1 4Fe-4S dicluster domain-containing protein [Frankia sp. AgB1.8]
MVVETKAPQTVIAPAELGRLVDVLRDGGYQVIGPTIHDGAIVYDEITAATQLPTGWTDVQEAAAYRLERRADEARFGYAVGPHSWKRCLLPPRLRLLRAQRDPDLGFDVREELPPDRPMALLGVRSCELHAIAIQDRILADGRHRDDDYAARREDLFIVAVNCHEPGGTCFCVSMGTGPAVSSGYDLVLSEILDGEHRLLVEAGTSRGRDVLDQLAGRTADLTDREAAAAAVRAAGERMGRTVEAEGLRDLLADNLEHPRWDDVAERCLTCGNCTMVCPTCFCTSVEDVSDLTGETAERWRTWESCFSLDHSHLHGGDVRAAGRSRYRQWLTHKFGTWHDQFGTSGCVGCGRCITWCPVGIDVTEELAAIRADSVSGAASDGRAPKPTGGAAGTADR